MFKNLPIAKKLALIIAASALFMVLVSFTGYTFLQNANNNTNVIYSDGLIPVQLINDNRTHQRAVLAALLEMMITSNIHDNERLKREIDQRAEIFNKNSELLKKSNIDDFDKKALAKIDEIMEKYRTSRNAVVALATQNKNVEAYQLYKKECEPLAHEANEKLRELSVYYTKHARALNDQNTKDFGVVSKILLGLSVASFTIITLLGVVVTRAIASPLKQVVATVAEVASGNFNTERLDIKSRDETGQVATAINEMTYNLRTLIKQVASSAEQVAASSEELTASADQSAQATNQIAESINDVAVGATEQMGATDDASAIVEQLSAGIQQVAATTNQVAVQSAQAAEKAKEGGKAAENAISQMIDIEDTVNNSAQVVEKLGERSKEIGQIVETISGIAGQTNLLALNAAIEAARAGEQGRGFAVVAEEVRKLAEQSQEAAKKIAELIGEIQVDTDKAVVAMNDGTREVKKGAEVVNAAGSAFQEIVALVTQVSGQVKDTSVAVQQMAAGSQQIVSSVKKIDALSKKSASQSQNVSAATEEQLASMEEIATSSQALAKLAQELQFAVAKFQV